MKRAVWLSVATALAVVVLVDRTVAGWVGEDSEDLAPDVARAKNVVVFENSPERMPTPRPGKSVLLIGNSHTYALPALEPGLPLRPDPGVTLIDELAKDVGADATFYRLAHPNFLPFEMLVRTAHLIQRGYRPNVVVIGLTWRNIARDTELRPQLRRTFRERGFADALSALVKDEEIAKRVHSEDRAVQNELEREQKGSSADRLDRRLTSAVGEHVALLGKSRPLRVRLYRILNNAITAQFISTRESYAYDVIPTDLAFNLRCLDALFEMLARQGARVIIYQAPERTDYSPLLDPARQEEAMRSIGEKANALGFLVLDARGVVPNEHWGWAYESPDRSHFTEPGHSALARFLTDEGREIWSGL